MLIVKINQCQYTEQFRKPARIAFRTVCQTHRSEYVRMSEWTRTHSPENTRTSTFVWYVFYGMLFLCWPFVHNRFGHSRQTQSHSHTQTQKNRMTVLRAFAENCIKYWRVSGRSYTFWLCARPYALGLYSYYVVIHTVCISSVCQCGVFRICAISCPHLSRGATFLPCVSCVCNVTCASLSYWILFRKCVRTGVHTHCCCLCVCWCEHSRASICFAYIRELKVIAFRSLYCVIRCMCNGNPTDSMR